jgi:hypothetical protein
VAELVDALVSGTSGAIRGGSSPLLGTITYIPLDFRDLNGTRNQFWYRSLVQIVAVFALTDDLPSRLLDIDELL